MGDDSRCCQVGTSKVHFIMNNIRFVIDYFVSVSILVACNIMFFTAIQQLVNAGCCVAAVHGAETTYITGYYENISLSTCCFFVALFTGWLGYLIHLGTVGPECTLTFLLRFTCYWMVCSLV